MEVIEDTELHGKFLRFERISDLAFAVEEFSDHTRPGEKPSDDETENRCDELADACERYLAAHKAVKATK